jgi:hypothetical protein
MTTQTMTVMLGGNPLFRAMPGGNIMMPLMRSERLALAKALRDTLNLLDDVTQPVVATECD